MNATAEALLRHTVLQLSEDGYACIKTEDPALFEFAVASNACLMLLVRQPNPDVSVVETLLEHWSSHRPKYFRRLVLATVWTVEVPENFRQLLARTGRVTSVTCAVALDLCGRKLIGKLNRVESSGLSLGLGRALTSFDPEHPVSSENLHERIEELTERTRKAHQELSTVTPWVTRALVAACVVVFVITTFAGGSTDGWTLLRFGANDPALDTAGQTWRWGSSMFLHIGFLHLFCNMTALWMVGESLERMLGSTAFGALYAVAGLGGSAASEAFGRGGLSAGASGAIFGLLGAGLCIQRFGKGELPAQLRRSLLRWMGPAIIYSLIYGFSVSYIDNACHLGGLVTGGLFALALISAGIGRLRRRELFPLARVALATVALIPWLCLGISLNEARRFPTPASYPTRLVMVANSPYTLELPLFLTPGKMQGHQSFSGGGIFCLPYSLRTVAGHGPVDFSQPDVQLACLGDLSRSANGQFTLASHESIAADGKTWLLVKLEYHDQSVGYLAYRGDTTTILTVLVKASKAHADSSRELLLSVFRSSKLR